MNVQGIELMTVLPSHTDNLWNVFNSFIMLQVLAIEFVFLAIDFVPLAIEFIALALAWIFICNKIGSWSKHENKM